MPLARHTGPFPVHWRAPKDLSSLHFMNDVELLLKEQSDAIQRNEAERDGVSQAIAAAQDELLNINSLISYLCQ